uniref:Uncharacterized protein n=1 Tax=Cyanothece sp. (strain PCC 7425 / ATCC 29141) TaxID=395961 RepID=B8HMY7_CYAP4
MQLNLSLEPQPKPAAAAPILSLVPPLTEPAEVSQIETEQLPPLAISSSPEVAELAPQETSALAVVPTPFEPDYSSLSLKELQQLCRDRKLPWRTKNRRFNSTELIAILQGEGAIALPAA